MKLCRKILRLFRNLPAKQTKIFARALSTTSLKMYLKPSVMSNIFYNNNYQHHILFIHRGFYFIVARREPNLKTIYQRGNFYSLTSKF